MKKALALIASCLVSTTSIAHGLTPMRLFVASGTTVVVASFTALNNYNDVDRFSFECYKHDLNHPAECVSAPALFVLAPHSARKIKVRLTTEGDDVYFICSKENYPENNQKPILSRICARVGVGVDPTPPKQGNRSNKHQ